VAEVQDINKLLDYLRQREQNLSRYSDKLRQSLIKIASVFGPSNKCQNCDWYVDRHPTIHAGEVICNKPTPKISVSVDVIDDEPFYIETSEYAPGGMIDYKLAFQCHKLGYIEIYGQERSSLREFVSAPREVLKELIKSGRLIPFLEKVADTLANKCAEYKEVAEVAEKMAQAVQP